MDQGEGKLIYLGAWFAPDASLINCATTALEAGCPYTPQGQVAPDVGPAQRNPSSNSCVYAQKDVLRLLDCCEGREKNVSAASEQEQVVVADK